MIPALRTMTRPREPPETAFQTATGTRTALFLMDNLRRLRAGLPRSRDLAFANLDLEPQSQDWNSNQSVTPTRNRSVTYVLTRPIVPSSYDVTNTSALELEHVLGTRWVAEKLRNAPLGFQSQRLGNPGRCACMVHDRALAGVGFLDHDELAAGVAHDQDAARRRPAPIDASHHLLEDPGKRPPLELVL